MTGIYRWINLAEAALWAAMGLVVLVAVLRGRGGGRLPWRSVREGLVLAVALVAMGASDVVETQTGAWWRPWWLLAWKSVCVAVLGGFVVAWASRRGDRSGDRSD